MARSRLTVTVSKVWTSDWASMENLVSSDRLYADLKTLVDGKLLPGTDLIAAGKHNVSSLLENLMRLRRLKTPPVKFSVEFVELSGYKYDFDYPVSPGADLLLLTVRHDKRPVRGFERLEFDMPDVQAEVTRFRQQIQELLLRSSSPEAAARWWFGNCLENFDGSPVRSGKP